MSLGPCRDPKFKRLTILFLAEAAVQGVNLVCYILPNLYLLCNPSGFYSPLINWCGWLRWTCWNTVSNHPLQAYVYTHAQPTRNLNMCQAS